MALGVLALQGDFAAHAAVLRGLGEEVVEVRRVADLQGLAGLAIPGGESTALLRLMRGEPWFDALRAFHARGGALFGTCAGAILLARDGGGTPPTLGLLDVAVQRNAYGRQVDSCARSLTVEGREGFRGVFIRAPRLVELGPRVHVLARAGADPVAIEAPGLLATTFHPELTEDPWFHAHFLTRSFQAER